MNFTLSFFRNIADTKPVQKSFSLSELRDFFSTPEIRTQKDGPLFSGAIFSGTRKKSNVESVGLLCLDFDHETNLELDIQPWIDTGCIFFLYTTFNHRIEKDETIEDRFRIVIPLANPITPELFTHLWNASAWFCNHKNDSSCKDPSRIFYTPSHRPNQPFLARTYGTELLDAKQFVADVAVEQSRNSTQKTKIKPIEQLTTENGCISEIQAAQNYLSRLNGWRADDYNSWIAVGSNLKILGNNGLELWDTWSQQSPKYAVGVCGKKWATLPEDRYGLAKLGSWANLDSPRVFYSNGSTQSKSFSTPKSHSMSAIIQINDTIQSPYQEFEQLTDLGNSKRFARMWQNSARYVTAFGKWYLWKETHWAPDETDEIFRMGRETIQKIYDEAAHIDDSNLRKSTAKWALRCETRGKFESMLSLAKSELPIAINQAQLDCDPWLLACKNGTINLRTGTLQPNNPTDLITKCLPVEYKPEATCPNWLEFLNKIMAGDRDLIQFLQRTLGYSLTGVIREHALFFMFGAGANGKSTLIETIQHLLGPHFQKAPTELLMHRPQGHGIPNEIARLRGVRMVVAAEVDSNHSFRQSLLKDLTGGDTLVARFLHHEYFEFQPTHKLWLYGNHKPTVAGTDDGIWRRINLIPFQVQIPPSERDTQFKEKFLLKELSGILSWLVQGCLSWQAVGIGVPEKVYQHTDTYRTEQDSVRNFLAETCLKGVGTRVGDSELFGCYTRWANENNERILPHRKFNIRLIELGLEKIRLNSGNFWKGIGLLESTY